MCSETIQKDSVAANGMPFELLTLDEYALRLKLSRTTIFAMKKNKKLTKGVHYIQVGRALRFIWSIEAVSTIGMDSSDASEPYEARVAALKEAGREDPEPAFPWGDPEEEASKPPAGPQKRTSPYPVAKGSRPRSASRKRSEPAIDWDY